MLTKTKFAAAALAAIVLAGGLAAGAVQAQAHPKFHGGFGIGFGGGYGGYHPLSLSPVPLGAEVQCVRRFYRLRARLPMVRPRSR